MPKLASQTIEQHGAPTGTYGYSAVKVEEVANAVTLVTIVQDVSSSVWEYKDEMEACLGSVVEACKKDPRTDNLLIRLVSFNSNVNEVHGFKSLEDCEPKDYVDSLQPSGATALFDASEAAISAVSDYAGHLNDNSIDVNSIVIIITDGEDNASALGVKAVRKVLTDAMRKEALESIVTILVGVRLEDSYTQDLLDKFKDEAGLTQFVPLKDASSNTLAKLANFISKSISATSQAITTGGPSKSIPLNID